MFTVIKEIIHIGLQLISIFFVDYVLIIKYYSVIEKKIKINVKFFACVY